MKTNKQTEKNLINDIYLMALDSECRLFVGTEEETSTEEALALCRLPESVFEYQKETGCNYKKIISLFDKAVQSSSLISMLLVRVEAGEIFRHSNYQILTADFERAKNYIINETGTIEYEIAQFKNERNIKCKHALKAELEDYPISIEETYNPIYEDRAYLNQYNKETRKQGQQVVIGNAVGIRFFNYYLEEKKQGLDNEILLLEKKIYMHLFNEAIEEVILYQDGHFIVSRRTSILINNLRDELEELQEDYDYEYRVKDMLIDITSLYDIYYLRINDNKTYYSFNRKNIIKYAKEEIEELKNKKWEGTDLINVNCFIIDAIKTNIPQETIHSML